MKTDIFMLFAASALVLFSCAKEKSPAPEQDAPMRFAVTVEGATKASMTSADLNQFYLKVTGPDNAFSFYDTIVKEGETWKASSKRLLWKDEKSSITYAAASYGALGPDYLNVSVTDALFSSGATMGLLTDQSTQAKLNAADLLTMKETTLAFADTEDGIVPVTLKHGLAKVNFVVSIDNAGELTAEGIKDVVVSGVYNAFSFKPLTGEVTVSLGASRGAVVPFLSSIEEGVVTFESVLVPETLAAGALSLYITVNGKDFQWTNSEALTLVQGGEYTVPVSIDYNTVPSGPVTPDPTPAPTPLSGVFTVSAGVPTGKTVQFSPGNLRYASGAWSFFDHQYDYYATYSADAWDKFGWSNSTNNFGMSTSTDNAVYRGDLVDWGTVPGIGTGWFTLSNNEWVYLFNTRSASTVNSVANARYAKGKVNGVYGIILFPDTYTHPTGVTLPVGINNVDNTGWNGNNYSAADWTAMETAGCVFLPAAGYREGTSVQSAGSSCSYRSSTRLTSTTDMVNYVYFTATNLNVSGSNYGRYGQCIRLVCDATAAAEATPSLSLTSPAVGQVIGSDGKNYAYGSLPTGVTAVAMICYVSGSSGLALALTDEGEMNWSTAQTTCAAHTPAFTGGTWKLASKDEWDNMVSAVGSYDDLREGFSSVGGTNMSSDYYWSSTEHDLYFAWVYDFDGGSWDNYDKDDDFPLVRACLAF